MRLAFDIEANDLLDNVSQVHCLVTKDIDTGIVERYFGDTLETGIRLLMTADLIIGHNVICYDLAVLEKLYPWFHTDWSKVRDTLNLSRLLFPNLSDLDGSRGLKVREALAEKKRLGSHALEAWGIRLGFNKLDYQGGWEKFNEDMLEYCVIDVEVTDRLWKAFEKEEVDPRASYLEHRVQEIIARQERFGFPFDEAKANALTATLLKRKAVLDAKLQDTFLPFYMIAGAVTPKRTTNGSKQPGTWQNAPYTKIKLTLFNPGSTHHIAHRLKALYGWEPTEFTPSGLPKVDEAVLSKLPWPEAKLLAEYFMVQKRLALLSEGDKSFAKHVRNGRCYGSMITNGAVTGRGTHKIIANIPRPSSPYGNELRDLFTSSQGRVLCGIDVSGLELRMLAHFLARFDDGAYGKIVCEGDVHTANQLAAGLATRNDAKTFIFAMVYGAGDEKIGSIAKPNASSNEKRRIGKRLKASFIAKTKGFDKLLDAIKSAAERGYLVGLDGRKVPLRSEHSALNFLLQGAGSLICKRWMVEVDDEIRNRGWKDKVQQLIWVHDEINYDCDMDIAQEFCEVAVECIVRAGAYFDIRVPLTGQAKIGSTWKEAH